MYRAMSLAGREDSRQRCSNLLLQVPQLAMQLSFWAGVLVRQLGDGYALWGLQAG